MSEKKDGRDAVEPGQDSGGMHGRGTPEADQGKTVSETMESLGVTRDGLSSDEAKNRLDKYGPNALAEKKQSPMLKFLMYFWGPIPWMIEIAAVLSILVKHWPDLIIIVVLLLVNAVIGFWQEFKADNAIELLKQKLALKARVRRDGKWETIEAKGVVPGDIVRLRLGDIVPADAQMIEASNVSVDQSALTGESLPVDKNESDPVYSGTIVQRGEGDGVVTATGGKTFFGKTARLVEGATKVSHYHKAVLKIGHFLIITTLALAALIITLAIFRQTPFLSTLQFTLILTIAAIPVALPAVLSVTMAVGAEKLSRQKAIVSRLVSIEEMASMDVLCSDKTGTLTQNRLKVGEPALFADVDAEEAIRAAALASREEDQDPIEVAILAEVAGGAGSLSDWVVTGFQPFDPVAKRTEATVSHEGRQFKVSKGAAQAILDLCEADDELRGKVGRALDEQAERGDRTLAVARTDDAGKWRFLALLPLADPPREDSAPTIESARKMGVQVKMVTGDHLAIAKTIAKKLNLGQNIYSAEKAFAKDSPLTDEQIEKADGFAQVFPEHKYKIVEILQRLGHIVGMTGDGVNDAPALKKADMGVAVSGATDAARSAADLVLTAPGLSVIVDAIKEARRIFERMNSYAIYRIAETLRVLLFMTAAIVIFDFYPVTAIMIIILALLNDGPIMLIAYDNTRLAERPTRWHMPRVIAIASVLGVMGVFASFVWFFIGKQYFHLDENTVKTLMFLKLAVAGHMTIYLARTGERHFWEKPLPAPALFWTCESTQAAATVFAVYGWLMPPLGWKLAGLTWAYATSLLVVTDLVKVHLFRLIDHTGHRRESAHLERIGASLHSS